jgi:molecular chaperone DnaJ
MKLKEAFEVLEIPQGSSKEEAKKAFRKLAASLHPDNKETGNEAKFKKINQAFQLIESGKNSDEHVAASPWSNHSSGVHGVNFGDLFGDFFGFANPFSGSNSRVARQDIRLDTIISFRDSVLGCQVSIKYKKKIKCQECNGQGGKLIDNCSKCHGKGKVEIRRGNTVVFQQCDACGGKTQRQHCTGCRGARQIEVESEGNVSIDPGTPDNTVLRLSGHGNFISSSIFGDEYSDAYLSIKVNSFSDLSIQGQDVVSKITISLLEALEGCDKKVNTIDGEKDITIPAKIRNKEEVAIPNLGVGKKGSQRVIVNVEYPSDTDQLIQSLKEK